MGRYHPGDVVALSNPLHGPVPSILVLEEIDGFYILAQANDPQMPKFLRPVSTVDATFEPVVLREVRNAVHEGEQ
jgi:hypothetical protein